MLMGLFAHDCMVLLTAFSCVYLSFDPNLLAFTNAVQQDALARSVSCVHYNLLEDLADAT
jgi:hypothetical protein